MTDPFLSEIRMMSFNFPPRGWALCNGQLLPINQNQALFSLLGTMYGGDGQVNFALPNLQGRAPMHVGNGFSLAQKGGETSHTLSVAELPAHNHNLSATNASATQPGPSGNYLATTGSSVGPIYSASPPDFGGALAAGAISNTGGSQAHQNMQPYLVINFSIALQGIFPSQS